MPSIKKSRMRKAIRDMSFEEQLAALDRDPRFKALVDDVRDLSPEQREALQEFLVDAGDQVGDTPQSG